MPLSTVILDAAALRRALARIAHEIAERNENSAEVALMGIPRGGVILARRLAATLQTIWNHPVPVGELDVSMHRDDLDHQASHINVLPTVIPFDITGKTVILVDDVLFSGRTTDAGGVGRVERFWPSPADSTGGAGGPGPSRAAHQSGLCRKKYPNLLWRTH